MRILGTTASGVANETIPGAPQSFTATAVSSTQINLSWAAPASNGGATITSYTLKRGATTIYTGAGTSFNNTGLSFATGYSYTVLATNSVGDGPTASASATTLVNVPSAPTSFSASAGSSSSINLSWAAPSSNGGAAITSYTVKRGATTIYTGAGTSVTDTGLAAVTGYSYTVLANNSAGAGPTASASATTTAGVPGASSFTITASFQDGTYVPSEDPEADGTFYPYWTYNTSQSTPSNNGSAIQYMIIERSDNGGASYYYYDIRYSYNNWNIASFSFGSGNPPGYFRVYFVNGIGAGPPSNALYLYHQGS
jgi:chitodextrinase